MWDGLRKVSIYPVFIVTKGGKEIFGQKTLQQPKLEIAFPTCRQQPCPPFEYASKAALFPLPCFLPRHAGGQNKESEETTRVPPSWYLGDWVVLTFKLSLKLLVARLQRNSDKPFGPWGFPLITHLGWWPFFLSPYNCTAQSLMPCYLLYHLLDAHMSYLSITLEDLVNFWKT